MIDLPKDIIKEITNKCDASTQASLFITIKNNSPLRTGRCLAEQALIDGHYQLFLYAIERQPLLSTYYLAAIKGNLPEAIALLQNNNIKYSQKAVFHAVRHNRPEIFALFKRRDQGTYALKCCTVPDRPWLPKIMRAKNPVGKKLLYYAVKYGNLELVEKIIYKQTSWVTEEMLWLAKVKGHRDVLDFLFSIKKVDELWIYLIDDFQLFERRYPDWKEDILVSNTKAWTWGAFEIAWHILTHHAPEALTKDNYNTFELFQIMTSCFGFRSRIGNNQEMFPTIEYMIFFLINYEGALKNKERGRYFPVLVTYILFPEHYLTSNYEYAPEHFTKPESLRITTTYAQDIFALWCEKNNIALEKSHLFQVAVERGNRNLLDFLFERGYVPSFKEFLFSLQDPNPKRIRKTILDRKCVIEEGREGRWTPDLILPIARACGEKHLFAENIGLILNTAPLQVVYALVKEGLITKEMINNNLLEEEEKRILDYALTF